MKNITTLGWIGIIVGVIVLAAIVQVWIISARKNRTANGTERPVLNSQQQQILSNSGSNMPPACQQWVACVQLEGCNHGALWKNCSDALSNTRFVPIVTPTPHPGTGRPGGVGAGAGVVGGVVRG